MSGKAFAQTIRGHFLVDSCLNYILINKIVKKKKKNPEGFENIDCLEWVYNNGTKKTKDTSEVKKEGANTTTWLNRIRTRKTEIEKQRHQEQHDYGFSIRNVGRW